jgi:hypothetical protein
MSHQHPLIKPDPRWEQLSYSQQFMTARQAIARRRREWQRRHPGLHSVGFGIRHEKGKRLPSSPAGILFVVRKKPRSKKATRALGNSEIPKHIRIKVPQSRGYIMVAVPTDVIEAKNHQFAAWTPPFASCDATNAPIIEGSACCALGRNRGSAAEFILGCHHVFMGSENNLGLVPGPVDHISCNGKPVGQTPSGNQVGAMNPGSPPTDPSDDAALSPILDAGRANLRAYWSQKWYPNDIERNPNNCPVLNGSYAVFTDRIGAIVANYVGHFAGYFVPVIGGQEILIPEVLLYEADCVPGDSGSPFYAINGGTVIGMHFARMQSDDTPSRNVCLCQPMWRLASPSGPFNMDLYLGRP